MYRNLEKIKQVDIQCGCEGMGFALHIFNRNTSNANSLSLILII
jgi:hypothetical protein